MSCNTNIQSFYTHHLDTRLTGKIFLQNWFQYLVIFFDWLGVVTEQTFPKWPYINVTVGVGSSLSHCHTNSGLSIFNRLNLHPQLLTVGKNILSINIRIPLIYNSIPLRVHFLLLYIYIMYWTARREEHNWSSGSEISYWSYYFDLRTFPLLMRDQWKLDHFWILFYFR